MNLKLLQKNRPALRPVGAFLSKKALLQNLSAVRKQIKASPLLHRSNAEVMAMVKANAYGHDLGLILPELERQGVKRFAVATLQEGLESRALSQKAKILVLGGTFDWTKKAIELLKKNRLEVAASDLRGLKTLLREEGLPVHLKLDTGMNRLGIKPSDWSSALEIIKKSKTSLLGLFTHYATSSDAPFLRQVMLFEEAVRWFKMNGVSPALVHSENSGALFGPLRHKRGILSEIANLVRPGISLYGYTPRGISRISSLSPVLELVGEVVLIKHVEPGEGMSYGHLYKARKSHDYGVVPLGYADGLSKSYFQDLEPEWRSSKGKRKGRLKICGAICMDMVMVRSTKGKLQPKDQAVLWGRFPNPVIDRKIVEAYELNLRLSKRIPRMWGNY